MDAGQTEFKLTDKEAALLPTDDEVRQYAERGWYLSRKLFTDDEIDVLTSASDRYYAGHRDRTLPVRPARLAYWTPEDGPVQRHNDYIHYEDDRIAAILRKPLLGAVAARLAEADEIRVFQATMIYKPPRPDERTNLVPWHFDKHYWATCTSERMLTAFIPFHDCGTGMGTITMIDGSHRWREAAVVDSATRHFAERDRSELDRMLAENATYNSTQVTKVPMEIPKGHVSFHHCRTYHGSGPNLSDRPRRAISLHLQDGANQHRPFQLSDGSPVEYNHDVLVRRTPAGEPDYSDPAFCPVVWRSGTGR
ncbi:phytanoyl-CoA dioxygenase family protein [Streptomyces sp. So13.3]|uniref:phytanoyl-CoA dioxygenase family protein n=1 Tax=Streptomyces TaxID=1883 RepID=UPI001107422F|nr:MULTISPECIES: phytanoyl-CoA dioxygenase family protein [Streptomyces]MCZ4097991.1 phytanoyl-CoA dioxygenase family protein [Streptomyces sp. H39-C1]QNA71741.1 phytanoyl-CoA dioxygenase family protein [Streptomyces sp. So13.3]